MAPIRWHRKQSVASTRRSRGSRTLRSGSTRKGVRCGTFPQRCISRCTETETVAESSHPFWWGGCMTRSTLILALGAVVVAGCERPTAPAIMPNADLVSATSATTFSGEATVVQAQVTPLGVIAPVGINLVATGALPESGGALNATLLQLSISKEQTAGLVSLDAEVGHAHTVGQGKQSRSQATVASLDADIAGNRIGATFLEAQASAVCDAVGGATATGSSVIADLVVNGTGYSVGTQPNQVIVDLPAVFVIANEQKRKSGNASDGDITVNALHVTAYAVNLDGSRGAQVADVIIASAHADVHCGICTDLGDDFTTGGGWIAAGDGPHARRVFAVAGGYKNGLPWGHLTYLDKATGLRVKGTGVLTYKNTPTDKGMTSVIEGTGELADGSAVRYTATVTDNGEPGDADEFSILLDNGYKSGGVLGG